MSNLEKVNWSALPKPEDDGAADHLPGRTLLPLALEATDGSQVNLAKLRGLTVLYIYPMTGQPGKPLPNGWDLIPGARGCTPQSCAFRDYFTELKNLGISALFGLSTQESTYQHEAAERLHLPFPLLSDHSLNFANSLSLPCFQVGNITVLKRIILIINDAHIQKVFYPVFPPDRSATIVMNWLKTYIS